jgi:hypothetical protein
MLRATLLRTTLLRAASAALLVASASAQVFPDSGFAQDAPLDLMGDRAYGSLSDGGFISFDGLSFERYDAAGALVVTYGTTGAFLFPSFVEIDPSETLAVVGESSNGDLFAIDLVSGTVTTVANMAFNYDLAFDSIPGLAYVSASLGGFGAGNDIVRLDLVSGATTVVAHVQGPSGPLEVDANGDLFYVTVYEGANWPPPLGEEDLILWSDAQLDSGNLLSEADALYLTAGLNGGSSIEYDPHSGYLFLANTNSQGAAHEILRLDTTGDILDLVAKAPTWIANLEVTGDGGPGTLAPFQPLGARLHVQNTDFGGSLRDRATLVPARTQASFVGPASGKAGPATVTFDGAPMGGSVVILLARSNDVLGQETYSDQGWGAPTFLAFSPGDVLRRITGNPVDQAGQASLTFHQIPAWEGALAFQAILYDADGHPIGTSTHVINQ